uniref:TIDP2690 n=1 Tax=Arundo donax TaxID=35708 RepID=A0A0A9EQN2_ARUDO
MKHIAATFKSNSCGRCYLCNINTFINIHNIFAFWMHLH